MVHSCLFSIAVLLATARGARRTRQDVAKLLRRSRARGRRVHCVEDFIMYVVKAAIFRRVQDNITGIEERVLINTRRKAAKNGDKSSSELLTSQREELHFESSEVTTSSSDEKSSGDESTSRRKCKQCKVEMKQKWRQPDIRWICGAYQRARRSFKSSCMMEYRNCQDGTMFVKIHEHRCKDDDKNADIGLWHGQHMFYDYKVKVEGDRSGSKESDSRSESSGSYTFEKHKRVV